ncbi:aspartate--tRNA(Asn) ligase [Candidatus Aerophobetes bacterium]|nr:aspartate--tRNA(Asn) ligase [Candidatus Aerophobetes bacterium]
MERTMIGQLKKELGKSVKIQGWISTVRNQGRIKFLLVRDVSGIVQVIITESSLEAFRIVPGLSRESVIEVVGTVTEEKQAPSGFELVTRQLRVISAAASELPIPVIEKGTEEANREKRLDWRWLDLRKPKKRLIFQVWTVMEHAFREHLINRGYIEIHSPKLMSTASETGSELFEVQYFDRKAYLAQSPQFYKQMAMAAGFEKVFETGPVFRANPSFTSRHDTEFTMYDFEISFIESHENVMREVEELITVMLKVTKESFGEEIKRIYGRELVVPKIPFPRLTMNEVKRILDELGISSDREGDLSPEEERTLCKFIKENKGHEFLFVTEWPASVRPFYHMRLERDPTLTKGFDLLWDGLEIITGSQREHRYEILTRQAKEGGINLESIQKYLEFFKYGCPPHGGCAPGPTRMLMKIFNIDNVREVTYLYRGVRRLTP